MLKRISIFVVFGFLILAGTSLGASAAFARETEIRTDRATNIDAYSATLNGFVDTNDDRDVYVWFEWDFSSGSYDYRTPRFFYDRTNGDDFEYTLNNLRPDTTYYFRAVALNDDGDIIRGDRRNFRTDEDGYAYNYYDPYYYNYDYNANYYDYNYYPYYGSDYNYYSTSRPRVVTQGATAISETTAVLNGYVDTYGNPTTRWFEWGTSRNFMPNTTNRQSAGAASGNFTQVIGGLQPHTTYFYRAVAQSSGSPVYGEIFYLNTRSVAPVYVPPPTQYYTTQPNVTPITVPVTPAVTSTTVPTITIPVKINPIVETPAPAPKPTEPAPVSTDEEEQTGPALQGAALAFGEGFFPGTLIGWAFLLLLVSLLVLVAQRAIAGGKIKINHNHANNVGGGHQEI